MALALTCLILGSIGHAELGERSSTATHDLETLHARTSSSTSTQPNCYSVTEIEGDGVYAKEFINSATDAVFMIRTQSRTFLNLQQLMGANNFAEYQKAQNSTAYQHHSISKQSKLVTGETPRLKIRVERARTVHKATLLQVSAVPDCVSNPEALP